MTKIRQMMAPMISSFGSICRSLRLHEAIAACIANTTTTTIKMMYGDKTHIIALVTTEEVDCVVSKQAAKAVEADGSLMEDSALKNRTIHVLSQISEGSDSSRKTFALECVTLCHSVIFADTCAYG